MMTKSKRNTTPDVGRNQAVVVVEGGWAAVAMDTPFSQIGVIVYERTYWPEYNLWTGHRLDCVVEGQSEGFGKTNEPTDVDDDDQVGKK